MLKKRATYWKVMACGLILILILNVAARFHGFCDWYVEHIFPVWINTYGRFCDLFPFSFGECLIVIGLVLVLAALVSGILYIFLKRKERYRRYAQKFYKIFLAVLVWVGFIYTLNCNILYNCSVINSNLETQDREYSNQELMILRNYLVQQINILSEKMERDEKDMVLYKGDIGLEAKRAMDKLSDEYKRLGGYYPDAKPLAGSRFMSLTDTAGIYFPFSLEANYNKEMYMTMYPSVICHEYAHLKGYIYEDEANFIAYLACIGSDDIFLQYSGYLSAYDYVDWAYFESVGGDLYLEQFPDQLVSINELAAYDDILWLNEEAVEEVYYTEDESLLNVDNMTQISEAVTDVSLKIYGVEDGIASYDRVTELLLQYYDGTLY
ncbi:MAG: DUF3810 domain-containing protein [Lachnospiraceae bacterium]|nr:DUF3810 domain-containing protein [Lachnospiraceae bacterium]